MTPCFFVSDLHGYLSHYNKLLRAIADEMPPAVFLGGDLLPHQLSHPSPESSSYHDFVVDFLIPEFEKLRADLKIRYPEVFVILGNDDPRSEEHKFAEASKRGLWNYIHNRKVEFGKNTIYGYAHVPPTPFLLKDWERYDVSRYVDPGCIAPEGGTHTVAVSKRELRFTTIQRELEDLTGDADLENAIFLFHTPPYQTKLDRAALDDRTVDYAPVDVHVGSIAVKRLIEARQPRLTLHGHIHESARLTGAWQERIGRTVALSAAHDGPELALIRFDAEQPTQAERELL